MVKREEAKHARELEKMAKEADHMRQVAAWQAFITHPLYRQAEEVYRQRESLHLSPGRATIDHPLTKQYTALREQAKTEVASQYGVKRVYCVA